MNRAIRDKRLSYLLIANAVVLLAALYAAVLEMRFPDFYYFSIQEDEYVEWTTFWMFVLGGIACVAAARRYQAGSARFPWYFCAVAAFCLLVAMEEISWGQRVIGYRPPAYFLEHNYQQELNIHNVIDTDYRKLVLQLCILGYGVLLPLARLPSAGRKVLDRVGVVPAPSGLVPAFAATFLVYVVYPWSHSGEWVELMLGAGILLSVLPEARGDAKSTRGHNALLFAAVIVSVLLGVLTSAASRAQRDAHPAILQAARDEIEALKKDFESGRAGSACSLHKRLYTFVVQYGEDGLLNGEFAALTQQGLPQERAEFLLDPWNSPYWIRDRCVRATRQRVVFVYSFGPNRRRDSTALEIRGDDVGAYISLP